MGKRGVTRTKGCRWDKGAGSFLRLPLPPRPVAALGAARTPRAAPAEARGPARRSPRWHRAPSRPGAEREPQTLLGRFGPRCPAGRGRWAWAGPAAVGVGRWVYFRPRGALERLWRCGAFPGSLEDFRAGTVRRRAGASAVVCGEAVSLLRERVAGKRIVVLRYQADSTGLNLLCEKGSAGNVLMLKGERWRGKRFEHRCHGRSRRAAAGRRAQAD
ncbi:uncharacterized protein LOC121093447 [Falco naumanni]|uniref:uncharacterized protein LOC121093447 n=1 Tax=Falco naumanni TaxID=148594 RepID=UPI001ADE39F5|nr:uncharacterized protein LOC121093447 [Falco naumanni]